MYIYILSLQLNFADSADQLTFTQSGIKKYVKGVILNGILDIQSISIPNLQATLDLGLTQINLFMSDIKIADVQLEDVDIVLQNSQLMYIDIKNLDLQVSMGWRFQQTTYPYIQDAGQGKISLLGVSLTALTSSSCNSTGNIFVQLQNAQLRISNFNIELSGGNSWIYQSMLSLISDQVISAFESVFQQIILDQISVLMQNVFEKFRLYTLYANHPLVKDERFTSSWVIRDQTLSLQVTGYVFHSTNLSDQYIQPQMLRKATQNKFNSDITLVIHEAAFNNVFYIYYKYLNLFSKHFTISSVPKLEINNAVALLSVFLDTELVYLLARPQMFTNSTELSGYVYFKFEPMIQDLKSNQIAELFNSVFVAYKINFALFVDLEKFTPVFDANEKVLRLVGEGTF
ncbi:Conserved_hypothetical protein [Hexamita inflata]|uniref:Lipid-binding serum glycoprotein N-terminal domain-containing protein n=1 Tax=Hexamita inflata TaxID=28002 RepID=A0AA86UQH2_9EUKA|nr:Conserved hypothetical protein [Hexamita inflata]